MVELTWLGLTAMIYIAIYMRKKNYELFYYTHHFAIVFLVSAMLHAWSFWSVGWCWERW
jgi:hypothetical protein